MDTANPATNRAPGTLLDSTDTDHSWWGPRTTFTQQSWPYLSVASFPNRRTPIFDGTDSYIYGVIRNRHQHDLPSAWTLDMILRPTTVSHSVDTSVDTFAWTIGGAVMINLELNANGSAANDRRKFVVQVTPTTSAGVAGTTTTITGATQVTVGTDVEQVHHVRVVRDGPSLYLYVDGVLDASTTSAANLGTYRHEGAAGQPTGTVVIGTINVGGNHGFSGRVFQTVLRAGADFSSPKSGLRDYMFNSTRDVRFALYGSQGAASVGNIYESSPFHLGLTLSTLTFGTIIQPNPWAMSSVQGIRHFSDFYGRSWNAVMAGGTLYWTRIE